MAGNARLPIAVVIVIVIIAVSGYTLLIAPNLSTTTSSATSSVVTYTSSNTTFTSTVNSTSSSSSTTTSTSSSSSMLGSVPVEVSVCVLQNGLCNPVSPVQVQLEYSNGGSPFFVKAETNSSGVATFAVLANAGTVIAGCVDTTCSPWSLTSSDSGYVQESTTIIHLQYSQSAPKSTIALTVFVQSCPYAGAACTPQVSAGVTIEDSLGFKQNFTNAQGLATFLVPQYIGNVQAACTSTNCLSWTLISSNTTYIGTSSAQITLTYLTHVNYCIAGICGATFNIPNAALVTILLIVGIAAVFYRKKIAKAV